MERETAICVALVQAVFSYPEKITAKKAREILNRQSEIAMSFLEGLESADNGGECPYSEGDLRFSAWHNGFSYQRNINDMADKISEMAHNISEMEKTKSSIGMAQDVSLVVDRAISAYLRPTNENQNNLNAAVMIYIARNMPEEYLRQLGEERYVERNIRRPVPPRRTLLESIDYSSGEANLSPIDFSASSNTSMMNADFTYSYPNEMLYNTTPTQPVQFQNDWARFFHSGLSSHDVAEPIAETPAAPDPTEEMELSDLSEQDAD